MFKKINFRFKKQGLAITLLQTKLGRLTHLAHPANPQVVPMF